MMSKKISWTLVDEAPSLASYSLLPIVKSFTAKAGIEIENPDISLSGRILAVFSDRLPEGQKHSDDLAMLGEKVLQADANIIKLPNISATVTQLKGAIKELQEKGYKLPDYPEEVHTDEDKKVKEMYAKCLGSAVNPVLRMGNSDRRAAKAVKKFAQKYPHKLKDWENPSKARVRHMEGDDFYGNEKSVIVDRDRDIHIVLQTADGGEINLKTIQAQEKEILDATYMNVARMNEFLEKVMQEAKEAGILFSIHLKATMMKVSDPVLFGHALRVYYKRVFEQYADVLDEIGVHPRFGLADALRKIEAMDDEVLKNKILTDIDKVYSERPDVAMVNSDKGITNFHNPNDIIIDASMPVVIRDGGKMWNKDGELQEAVAVIPDRTYAMMYHEVVEDCKRNGKFDVATMGNVSNVGLMAQKAEEYGSHPTTFELPESGKVVVRDDEGKVWMEHNVQKGDVWRMSRTKDIPVKDWVRLAVERAKITGNPAVFWLDENRAHDVNILKKVKLYLKDHDTEGLEIHFMDSVSAMRFTLQRVREGKDTISVTGNVLRDYLTDLFPILELGTSARMLSIVPLIAGGGLFETGAGGSAPKHVMQFIQEGHLRWDSLGEFLALAESLRFIARKTGDERVRIMAESLDKANEDYLMNAKSPSRKAGEPGTNAGHYYLAMYWAKALSEQTENRELASTFKPVFEQLRDSEERIIAEMLAAEGKPKDIGGYYKPDTGKISAAMRPSATLNGIIDGI